MSYALIDNASLTAVERFLGDIIVKNPDTINGDIVAVENFVQANLFYDDLICVDNYKQAFRDIRKNKFSYIRFLNEVDFSLEEIDQQAQREARQINPEIRGGEFVNEDFKALIQQLKLNMICTWDLRSSVYYLTMKMLGQPNSPEYSKYSELSSTIFNELSDSQATKGYWANSAKLVSSSGHIFTEADFADARIKQNREEGGMTNALECFIASLNWLAYKSIYYSLVAKYFKADSFIHPIRHAYQLHWFKKTGAFGHDYTSKIIHSLNQKINTTTSEILDVSRNTGFSLELPIFSAWIIDQCGNTNSFIKTVLELKKTDPFVSARQILREIHIAYDENSLEEGNIKAKKLLDELDKICADIKRRHGIQSPQGIQVSFLIKSINSLISWAGFTIPEFEKTISTPSFLQNESYKTFSTIFKDITNELTNVERLGGHRDLLASSFKIDDSYYTPPKVEPPQFRFNATDWKRPM